VLQEHRVLQVLKVPEDLKVQQEHKVLQVLKVL
jgi:hypothetical protein